MKGVIRIDRVVAEFHVWLDPNLFPCPKMKVKVLERGDQNFAAFPNLGRKDADGNPDFVAGLGSSVDEALEDLLCAFVEEAALPRPSGGYTPEDLVWSEPSDF